jgi:hypothetical protein
MARTAITVQTDTGYGAGAAAGWVTTLTDSANEMSVDLTAAPNLRLVFVNTSAGSLNATIPKVAGPRTFNTTGDITIVVPAAVGGAPGMNSVLLDAPEAYKQTGNVAHIDIVTATGLYVSALTWNGTPRG